MRDPDWLLDCQPREVQIEALRRSYGGFSLRWHKDDTSDEPFLLRGGPARGWSHYLEMRLGKTPTGLNEFELYARDYGIERDFVFCPNSYKGDWVSEAALYGSSVPWHAWDSTRWKDAVKFANEAKGRFGIAINYEALKGDNVKKFLADWLDDRAMLKFDESIKIKDHSSQQTIESLKWAKEAAVVRNLSGKPQTQGPHDLFPQFRAIGEFDGYNFYAYRNRFCKMGGFKAKKIVGSKNEDQLQKKLATCSFIAKRKDWGTVAGAEHFVEKFQMSPAQAKHYAAMDTEMATMLGSGFEVTVDMVVTKLMKLQQISSGFLYYDNKKVEWLEDPRKTAKMARLLDMMEEAPGKVIIPYHYGETGNALMECLAKYKPAVIRGAQWMRQNDRNVDTEKRMFNHDPACRVIIAQISASKYGHDLTGNPLDRCGSMFFYENTYSLDDRTQIEARNTTAFQDWDNTYHDYVCSPVERAAIVALAKKESLVEAVFGAYR